MAINIQTALDWMIARQGRVTYSMAYRNGPNSYDCSSAVFYALRHAGVSVPFIGNTETLFSMRGTTLLPITRADIRAGDIFVSGIPGGSANAYGHTGFALNETQAIHCSSVFNGIGVSSNADSSVRAYGGAPVYWFRVAGSNAPSPTPEKPDENTILITDVNDGKEYLVNEQLVELFGVITDTVQFNDVTDAQDLKQKGIDHLNNQPLEIHSLTVDFAQLYKRDERFRKIDRRQVVRVINDELNIDTRMRVEVLSFALDEDYQGVAEFGSDWKHTLTRKVERKM